MPRHYQRFLRQAENDYPNQPARAAKIRGIRRELDTRLGAAAFEFSPEDAADFLGNYEQMIKSLRRRSLFTHGRRRCRQMLNRPLSFVTAYDPETDAEWPTL